MTETEPRCKCCGLEVAELGDPDGFCTDCSIECVPLTDDDPDWRPGHNEST